MKYKFKFDESKCVACGACAVACMDQHDTSLKNGDKPFRTVTVVEQPGESKEKIRYLSVGCLHCVGAPCVEACPMGCLQKNDMGLTEYDNTACIGCHRCAMACPFGAPTFGSSGKMTKCDGCQTRLECGMLPACVRVCPTGALTCIPEEK